MAEEDLIFGKNRHFFGGIEPDNMKQFKVDYVSLDDVNMAKITATLPDDTVVNGQTLCTVAGALIIRKKDSMPENEFDGELVEDLVSSKVFYDSNVEENQLYYYAAYPYTTQGVYNRNKINSSVVEILNGYPPDALTKFIATSEFINGRPRIKLEIGIPNNSQIDGEDVNTVVGAIIRKSTTEYPTDENKGDFLLDARVSSADGTRIVTFYDTNVELNQTYYYSGFPYTTQNVFNRDFSNRAVATPTGKVPGNLKYFVAKAAAILQDPVVVLKYQLPDTDLDLPTINVQIRRKTGSYPTSIDDGTLVTTLTTTEPTSPIKTYMDKDVADATHYYYRAFPVAPSGLANTEDVSANKADTTTKAMWFFTLRMSPDVNAPAGACTYDGPGTSKYVADNLSYTPAKMDYGQGKFDPGDWDFEPGTFFMPRPCVLGYDGNVRYYLDPNDYSKKEDGSPADITSGPTIMLGNVMMEWPKVYAQVEGENDILDIKLSNKRDVNDNSGGWNNLACPSVFRDKDDKELTYMYTAVYPSVAQTVGGNTIYQSVSGKHPTVFTSSTTASDVNTIAKRCSSSCASSGAVSSNQNWNLDIYQDTAYINTLLVLMARTLDLQTAYGCGSMGVASQTVADSSITNGQHNTKGLFWGSQYSSSNKYPGIKIFGMEDYWGGCGRLTGTLALRQLKVDGWNDSTDSAVTRTVYSQVSKNQAAVESSRYDFKPGYLPENTFEFTSSSSGWDNDKGGNYSAARMEVAQSVSADGDRITYYSNQLQQSLIGNDFINTLGYGFDYNIFPWPSWLINSKEALIDWQIKNYGYYAALGQNASATTRHCDYVGIVDYPSGFGKAYLVYGHFGSDSTITTETLLKRIGPWYINYTKALTGCNPRICYKALGL